MTDARHENPDSIQDRSGPDELLYTCERSNDLLLKSIDAFDTQYRRRFFAFFLLAMAMAVVVCELLFVTGYGEELLFLIGYGEEILKMRLASSVLFSVMFVSTVPVAFSLFYLYYAIENLKKKENYARQIYRNFSVHHRELLGAVDALRNNASHGQLSKLRSMLKLMDATEDRAKFLADAHRAAIFE